MWQVWTLRDIMEVLDVRLKSLKISRSATKNFEGVKSETLNGWWAKPNATMRSNILLALLAGAGLEIWLRPIPRNTREREKYERDFAQWMTGGGIKLGPDSEIQVEQVAPEGVRLVRSPQER